MVFAHPQSPDFASQIHQYYVGGFLVIVSHDNSGRNGRKHASSILNNNFYWGLGIMKRCLFFVDVQKLIIGIL